MSVNFLLQTKEKRMQHSISNYRHCAVWHISGTYSFCTAETLFSSVAQSCPILCDPMDCSTPGLPVHHHLLEFTQTSSIESVMPSSHLILCPPLLLPPSIFPRIRVFSNESVLRIRWSDSVLFN